MNKKLSPAAIIALKEALSVIYWYKSNLRDFLYRCITRKQLLSSINWNNVKRQIASDIVDLLSHKPAYLDELLELCYAVIGITSFRHLEQLEDGIKKAQKAKNAVNDLKELVNTHQDIISEQRKIQENQKKAADLLKASSTVRQKLKNIHVEYISLISLNENERGYRLEQIMYDLFDLFDLDPKASFKNTGEQIDGAFRLDGTEFLFEARWRNEKASASALDAFSAKVKRKLENTLGLFLSMNGFSETGIEAHSNGNRPSIILMDGSDLMAVLEERIDFASLLLRKKVYAAHNGNIYFSIKDMLQN